MASLGLAFAEAGIDQYLDAAVYARLRRAAASLLRSEPPGHPMEAEDLLHETLLRLFARRSSPLSFACRGHFVAVIIRMMRQTLVDHARASKAQKRQPEVTGAYPDAESVSFVDHMFDTIAINLAVSGHAAAGGRQAKVVQLRVFGNASIDEIASELSVSSRTVKRDWAAACDWLQAVV